jgi:uncharacterized protein (TIGR02147 family)
MPTNILIKTKDKLMKKNSILSYDSFETFLSNEYENNHNIKRGEKKELAEFLNIHPTSLSQVFKGIRFLTDEQVFLLCEYLALTEIETEYLIILHQIYHTHNAKYKDLLIKKKNTIKKKSHNLSTRIQKDKELTKEEKAIFYSSWHYTSIWVFLSVNGGKTKDEIYQRLGIDKKQISEILEFLLSTGLCRLEKGKYKHQVGRLHLEKSSPILKQHHSNWRIKSIQKFDRPESLDLTFTAPLSLSHKDFEMLREELVQFIQKLSNTVSKTEPEEIFSLNLDFIKI